MTDTPTRDELDEAIILGNRLEASRLDLQAATIRKHTADLELQLMREKCVEPPRRADVQGSYLDSHFGLRLRPLAYRGIFGE